MNRRESGLGLAAGFARGAGGTRLNDPQPNVLIIMCDQVNASLSSCYGGWIPTPQLERLAK